MLEAKWAAVQKKDIFRRTNPTLAMTWRGISNELDCSHPCCSSSPACRFSKAPVFNTAEEARSYATACLSEPSNPAGLYHGTSLLTEWAHVEEQLLAERSRILRELGPDRVLKCREFFLNKRDAPITTHADPTGGDVLAQTAILSQYTDSAADPPAKGDIGMPNIEDYRRCFRGRFFGKDLTPEAGLPKVPPWEDRWSCAVFRGGATGEGVCPETNPRLKAAILSESWKDGDFRSGEGELLLDAKLTSWNQRQKIGKDGVVRVLDRADLVRRWGLKDVGRENFLSWQEQSYYKYALYLDGNVGAGRLGALLGLGFVILVPASRKPATFLKMHMKPMVHFIPLREDLEDLRGVLLWLRENDCAAHRISVNARELHRARCSRKAIESEMRGIVSSLPVPDDASLQATLKFIWKKARAAVYVLMDDTLTLRIFAPFANRDYQNDWPGVVTECGKLQEFLARVKRISGETITLPLNRWWCNGGLICNVLPDDVWGESMLPEMRLLLEAISKDRKLGI